MNKFFPTLLALCIAASMLIPAVQATPTLNAPKNFKAATNEYGNIQLTWSAVKGAQGYALYYLSRGKYVYLDWTRSSPYMDTSLSGEQTTRTRTYKVRAYTESGDKRAYGAFSSAVTASTCAAILLTVEPMSDRNIQIRWAAVPRADGYTLYRAKASDEKFTPVKTTKELLYNDNGLRANTDYIYKMKYYTKQGGKNVYSGFSLGYPASTLPVGKKYTSFLFVGNSRIFVPQTQIYFQKLADSQHQYVRVIEDLMGGSRLSDHLTSYQLHPNSVLRNADFVLLQEYLGFPYPETPGMIAKMKKYYRADAKCYFFPTINSPLTTNDIHSLYQLVSDMPRIKTAELCSYLYVKHDPSFFIVSQADLHPNDMFGYACALTIYCQFYHADPMKLPSNFVSPERIPGKSKAEKDAFIQDIKIAVKQALATNK